MDAAGLPELDLGTIRLRWLYGGAFRTDGASVFGQVPRSVWSMLLAPDEDNRVSLTARVLLVETADEFGLIEAGLPNTVTPRQRASPAVERVSSALFPNTRHVVQRREVEAIHDPEYPRRQGLEGDSFEVLLTAGLVALVDREAVAPGVRVMRTGGHTPGHQAVMFEGGRERAVCLGDLLPTRHHLDPVCVPAVDDDFPLDSIAAKRAQLMRAGQLGTWLTVAHDPEVLALRCGPDGALASELRSSRTSGGSR